MIFVPLSWNPDNALIVSVESVATVPLSTNVKSVFGDPAESLIVNVPLAFVAPIVIEGALSESMIGLAFENVFVPVNVFA